MNDEINTIKAALEKAKEAACVLGWISFGYKVDEALAALSTIDPDAIRRECAERAWDWFCGKSKEDNFPAKKELLTAAILGTEPSREKDGCFRCRNRPLPGASGELCKSCKLVIGKNYDPIPILATEPARGRGKDIKKTQEHDAGAHARCSYCGRYSDNPESLRHGIKCDCGKTGGWSGSFMNPVSDSIWSITTEPAREESK